MTDSEQEHRQRQRMEVVGQFVCGLAHDLNNLLTVIAMNAELLAAEEDNPVARRIELTELRAAADRAGSLTRRLLNFSRHSTPERELVDVGAALTAMGTMLRRLVRSDVKVVVRGALLPQRICVDAVEFDQVLLNLALNARDAMPAAGTLTMDCECTDVCRTPMGVDVCGTVQPGPHIRVGVCDTGIGIPEGVRQRMFEPFFTTKERGQGTGMGLTTVLGIVTGWGGHMVVLSRQGEGTTFDVFIPIADSCVAASGSSASNPPAQLAVGDRPRQRV